VIGAVGLILAALGITAWRFNRRDAKALDGE